MESHIDLHTHTYFSDGIHSPSNLVCLAKLKGLSVVSITDHDSVNGIEEAIIAGKNFDVKIIPGMEISTDIEDKEVHILGYFIDIHKKELQKYLKFFREERHYRAKRIIKKLNNLGINIEFKDVITVAKNSAIGRPHIASALLKLGIVNDYYEAFQKYLGDHAPAYEKKIHISHQSALKLISDSGGLSFLAHPGNLKESILMTLINAGIDGIEVIHPTHNNYQKKFYKGIINQYCLLESGGSDYHGGNKRDDYNFGKYFITSTQLEKMQKILFKNNV